MKPRTIEEALAIIADQREVIAYLTRLVRENMQLRESVRRMYVRTFLKPMFDKKARDV